MDPARVELEPGEDAARPSPLNHRDARLQVPGQVTEDEDALPVGPRGEARGRGLPGLPPDAHHSGTRDRLAGDRVRHGPRQHGPGGAGTGASTPADDSSGHPGWELLRPGGAGHEKTGQDEERPVAGWRPDRRGFQGTSCATLSAPHAYPPLEGEPGTHGTRVADIATGCVRGMATPGYALLVGTSEGRYLCFKLLHAVLELNAPGSVPLHCTGYSRPHGASIRKVRRATVHILAKGRPGDRAKTRLPCPCEPLGLRTCIDPAIPGARSATGEPRVLGPRSPPEHSPPARTWLTAGPSFPPDPEARSSGRRYTMRNTTYVLVISALMTAACADRPTEPATDATMAPAAQFAKGGTPDLTGCATNPDFVVTDDGQLRSAMNADAQPGDVIAIEGLIVTNRGATTRTPGLTITCASPGSGLVADPDVPWSASDAGYLLRIYAADVVITGLVLDAGAAPAGPVYAENNGTTTLADRLAFTDNRVTCGPGSCLFLPGVSGALVADNSFVADGTSTGVHLQGVGDPDASGRKPFPTDGARILRNTVVNHSPSPQTEVNWRNFAGIRVRDGDGVIVAQNRVEGPWIHTFSVAGLTGSTYAQNSGDGAQFHGINTQDISGGAWSTGNMFRNNQITHAGRVGVLAMEACYNTFVGNNLGKSGLDIAAGFGETTGGNTFVGNGSTAIDLGQWDCDGDGTVDPNRITGAHQVHGGLHLGPVVRSFPPGNGIVMH